MGDGLEEKIRESAEQSTIEALEGLKKWCEECVNEKAKKSTFWDTVRRIFFGKKEKTKTQGTGNSSASEVGTDESPVLAEGQKDEVRLILGKLEKVPSHPGLVDIGKVRDEKGNVILEVAKWDLRKSHGVDVPWTPWVNEKVAAHLIPLAIAYHAKTGKSLKVNNAYRSPEHQQVLYDYYEKKVAMGKLKRNPAAKPGSSNHENGGVAIDLDFGRMGIGNDRAAQKDLRDLAASVSGGHLKPHDAYDEQHHLDYVA